MKHKTMRAVSWFKRRSRLNQLFLVGFLLVGFSSVSQAMQGEQTTTRSAAPVQSQIEPTPELKVTTKEVTETEALPFGKQEVQDADLAAGKREVRTTGVDGVKTMVFEVTYTDGVETGRKLISDAVTTPPVAEVTVVGTYVAPPPRAVSSCDPNYAGACVPIAGDVDCSSGSGNGPAYVRGPVTVIGIDIYDLDRDGNGTGCENG